MPSVYDVSLSNFCFFKCMYFSYWSTLALQPTLV